MGTWGVGILSGDTASAVYDDYIDKYNDGLDHAAIRAEIEEFYAYELEDFNDEPVVWFALAQAQWDCGVLQPDVLERVSEIIGSGRDLESWDEESRIHQRQSVLLRFLRKLQKPKIKPLSRRKIKYLPAIYKPGDCLAIHLSDGEYGAALVLAADDAPKMNGLNLVGLLDYKASVKPTLTFFEQANWLYLTHHSHSGNEPLIWWCSADTHKKEAQSLELVGHIILRDDDPKEWPTIGSWGLALYQIEAQAQWDRSELDNAIANVSVP